MAIVRPNIYQSSVVADPLAEEERKKWQGMATGAQKHIGAVSQAWLRDLAIKDALANQREEAAWATANAELRDFSSRLVDKPKPVAPAMPTTSESGIPLAYIEQMKARDDASHPFARWARDNEPDARTQEANARHQARIRDDDAQLQQAVNQLLLEDRGETEPFEAMQTRQADEQVLAADEAEGARLDFSESADRDSDLVKKMLRYEQLATEEGERIEAERLAAERQQGFETTARGEAEWYKMDDARMAAIRQALLSQGGLEESAVGTQSGQRLDRIEALKKLLAEKRAFGEMPRLP